MLNFRNLFAGASRRPNLQLSPSRRTNPQVARRALGGCAGAVLALLSPISGLGQETSAASAPPVAYASVSELNGILDQVKQTATAIQADLSKMRIEKWKTDNSNKRQTQGNADSVQRNLQAALPDITAQLHASPEDMAASFKLYRNLDALYDVFGSLVESAGAFGSKDEFQSLSNDMNGLESARRALGERIQKLASAKEDELTRLRTQVKTLTAAPPPPPKKIVIDDTEPPKKPVKKKVAKPATPTKPASPGTATPAATPNPGPTK